MFVRYLRGRCGRDSWSDPIGPIRFCGDLWASARRPAVFRRCLVIAAVVGIVLTAVNLGGVIWRGAVDLPVLLKIGANFLVPFIVSNLGAMTTTPPSGGGG